MATPKKGLGRSFEKLFGEGKIKQNLFQKEGEEDKITLDSTKNNIDVESSGLFIAPEKADAVEEVEETVDDEASLETIETTASNESSNEEKIVESLNEDEVASIEVEEKANNEVSEIVKEAENIASETVALENAEDAEDDENEATGKPLYVPINHIHPNKDQPRKVFDEEKLHELANSIQNYGIISPIVVRRDGPQIGRAHV